MPKKADGSLGTAQRYPVLILEDDETIAQNLRTLLQNELNRSTEMAQSVEQAKKIASRKENRFSLAVVDVMLPLRESDYLDILKLDARRKVQDKTIRALPSPTSVRERDEVEGARRERANVLEDITHLIDREGGIKFVRFMRSLEGNVNQDIPVLFLSAIGDDATVARGKESAGNQSAWLVKPAAPSEIVARCRTLLSRNRVE